MKNSDFVVDNSVVMAWCFKDENNLFTDSVLESLKYLTAYTPAIWPLELVNVLAVAERRRRISESGITRFISLLNDLPLIVDQESPERMFKEILALSREYNLSSYDASYLDLAMRRGLSLATLDKKLIAAANACQIPLINID